MAPVPSSLPPRGVETAGPPPHPSPDPTVKTLPLRSVPRALRRVLLSCATLAVPALALAQGPLDVVFVSDSTNDLVWRLEDLDGDGTYHGPGETLEFYSPSVGSVPLSNNLGITRGTNGVVYVCDASTDVVLALLDLDGDGNCNAVGEHWVFFDGNPGGNASGVLMVSAQEVQATPDGRIWVASANTTSGQDLIFYLQDLDGDGNANGPGEAVVYYAHPGTSTGDSLPQDMTFGPDGALYYLENGSTGFQPKGIYRLEDLDGSGVIDQPNELTPFFIPPAGSSTAFFWGFDVDDDGFFYMADTGNERIWRFRDGNGDGSVDPATEALVWWSTAASNIWQVSVGNDGWLYVGEFQSPRRVLRLKDLDGDGVVDPATEVETVYDQTLALASIGSPRSLHVARDLTVPGIAYCYGDGSGASCPCGNFGQPGAGCATSTGAGARLSGGGSPSVSVDTLVLIVEGALPGQAGLVFAGLNAVQAPFGDGLRCAGGALRRLPVAFADANGSYAYASVASLLGVVAGDLRRFQGWFRDPVGSPCGSGFNLTNGYEIQFGL